jgi:hypothetical protein
VAAYRGKNWQSVTWPDKKQTEMIVIGRIDGAHLQGQIAHFIREIDRFKKSAVGSKGSEQSQRPKSTFSPEFLGRRKTYTAHREIEAQCDHGPLISALADELKKRGLNIGNDTLRDLYVLSAKGRVQALFEAKTDLSTSSVYAAVGQLMLHAAVERNKPRQIFVAPGTPSRKTQIALKKIGIEVLSYRWNAGHPSFINLGKLLA